MTHDKTNAMRLLDRAKIAYVALSYDYEENDLSGVTVAERLGLDPETVFKTLVLWGVRQPVVVALLSVSDTLDLKKLAALCGEKRLEPAPVKDLLALTGYMRGGCSPIGMKKPYPIYAHSSLPSNPRVLVNAGRRGMQLMLSPRDLVAFCGITLGDITRA